MITANVLGAIVVVAVVVVVVVVVVAVVEVVAAVVAAVVVVEGGFGAEYEHNSVTPEKDEYPETATLKTFPMGASAGKEQLSLLPSFQGTHCWNGRNTMY